MLLQIPDVLTPEQVSHMRRVLDQTEWVDGRVTAGHQSAKAKDNMQLPEHHPVAQQLGDMVLKALQRSALFIGASLVLAMGGEILGRYLFFVSVVPRQMAAAYLPAAREAA